MRINAEESTGLVIDIQERLFPVIHSNDELLKRTLILVKGLKILNIPVLITEQYPRGLGKTLAPIAKLLEHETSIEKIAFSCCGEAKFNARLSHLNKLRVIICGIESHVCVLQTVIDLIESGFTPVVVTDCTSSRDPQDKLVALERMRDEGAILTTSESILFELAGVAGTPQFKSISNLIK